ncbi:FUSC family protein [Arthrobacter glacialis]|uniref:FUSC family protein n=1 Tax=Arthrobacter glacialis TaxID=1664 RepID=UPI0010573D92|nr:aromatic acid exporter family protein [Arthrobacter glacialis]
MRSTVTGQRVLLAAKTALAVGIAWWLAPLMPGVVDDYPYYAPLGVLVSMYPTFMGSVRTGLQTLYGLMLGILLGAGVLAFGTPNVISLSLAVGAGVLLAGLPLLGAGRDYIPVATLLVLIIGGSQGQAFSLGYGFQMVLGVLVGLMVNVTIFPPLALDAPQARIRRARTILIEQLDDAAAALRELWPPDHEEWASRGRLLEDAVGEVRAAVHEAAESQRANPRARLRSRHRILSDSYEDLALLENITFHVRDLSEVLAGAIWEGPLEVRLRDGLREPLGSCLSATADVLRAWDDGNAGPDVFDEAAKSLSSLTDAVAATPASDSASLAPGATVALDVRRILTALRRRLLPDNSAGEAV